MLNKTLETLINNMEIQILSYGTTTLKQRMNKYLLPSYLLIYCLKGTTTCIDSDNNKIITKAGMMTLFEPFTTIHVSKPATAASDYYYVYFSIMPLSSSSIFKRNAFSTENSVVQHTLVNSMDKTIELLAEANANSKNTGLRHFMLQHFIRGIIAYIMFRQSDRRLKTTQFSSLETKIMDTVFKYTDSHLSEPINVNKLSLDIGVSFSSLNRVFKKYVKTTPGQFITRYKLSQSVVMLREGLSVKEIASRLGYSSSFHFSKAFKQVIGEPPSTFMHNKRA